MAVINQQLCHIYVADEDAKRAGRSYSPYLPTRFSTPAYRWNLVRPERVPRNAVSIPSSILRSRRRWRRGERDGGDKINWKIKITPHQTTLGVQHAIIFTPKRWAWVQSSRPPSELWPQHQRASAVTNACHLWRGNSRRRKNITLCSALMRCRGDWVWMGWFIRAIICCLYMNLHFWCENKF